MESTDGWYNPIEKNILRNILGISIRVHKFLNIFKFKKIFICL